MLATSRRWRFRHYHVDALRLDAIHAILDLSAKPFLQELAKNIEELSHQRGRRSYLIAESDSTDVRVIRPRESGGYGIDAQWCDDFHHSLRTLLTGVDEISGIETTQVIRYAARAMQLAEDVCGVRLEPAYIQRLERAPSNSAGYGNGARVYERFIKPAQLDLVRVVAHYAVSSVFEEYPETIPIYCYTAESEIYDRIGAGIQKLAIGRTSVRSDITWDEGVFSFAVLHLGDHNLNGGVRTFMGEEAFGIMHHAIKDAFGRDDLPGVIRLMDKHFGIHNYTLWHLFRDEQRKVISQI